VLVQFSSKALRDAVEVLSQQVSLLDPSVVSGPDAAVLLSLFTRAETICSSGVALAARRVADTNAHVGSGHLSAETYVAGRVGGSVSAAREVISVGSVISDSSSAVGRQARLGNLSFSKVREVVKGVQVDPLAEASLLEVAACDSLDAVARERKRLEAVNRDLHELAHKRRSLWWKQDGASTAFGGSLPNHQWAKVESVLGPLRDRAFRSSRRSGLRESSSAYCADGLVAMAELAVSGSGAGVDDSRANGSGGPVRKGKAGLGDNVDKFDTDDKDACSSGSETGSGGFGEGSGKNRGKSGSARIKATVHVVVDHEVLVRGSVNPGDLCEIEGVGPIPVDVARSMANDCYLRVLLKKQS
jgi:hypothetical protein